MVLEFGSDGLRWLEVARGGNGCDCDGGVLVETICLCDDEFNGDGDAVIGWLLVKAIVVLLVVLQKVV